MTIFGAAQLLAVFGVWAGNQLARWFAVAVVGLNAIGQMFIPAYPVLVPADHRGEHRGAVGACASMAAARTWVSPSGAAQGTVNVPGPLPVGGIRKGPGTPASR